MKSLKILRLHVSDIKIYKLFIPTDFLKVNGTDFQKILSIQVNYLEKQKYQGVAIFSETRKDFLDK